MEKIPKEMSAAVYRGVRDVRLETVPVPKTGPQEILVRVAVCGVCPTDLKKIAYGTVDAPRIFGHETAGTIVRCGALVRGWEIGQRVALHHHVPCLRCHACRHGTFAQCAQYKRTGITAGFTPAGGGYAEYVRVMPFVFPGIVRIPKRNEFSEGAMLEPVNTVLKAINRLALLPGDVAVVVGQGPIGLLFTRLLHLRGVNVVAADLFAERLKMARRFGARWTHLVEPANPTTVTELGQGQRALDAVIVTAPVDAEVVKAIQIVRGGGKVLLFAHTRRGADTQIDLSKICVDEKDLIGSYSADVTLQKEVSHFVFSRSLDVRSLVTDRYPLSQIHAAIERAATPSGASLKVLIASA